MSLIKTYTEQFWKIKTTELSHKVIPSSVKMNFARTLKHLLIKNYLELSRREPGKLSLIQRENLPSYYPKNGFGEIAKRISKRVINNGGEIYTGQEVNKIVLQQAKLANQAKLDAIVCSPKEVNIVRKVFKKEIITPGIRFDSNVDDQKRTLAPKQAYKNGSDWLVIGRPITKGNIKNNLQNLINHLK